MFSHYDLVDELTSLARTHGFVHSDSLALFREKFVCVSGSWFVSKLLSFTQGSVLCSGLCSDVLRSGVHTLKQQFADIGLKFKVIFSGSEICTDKQYFKNQVTLRKKLNHLIWTLELHKHKSETTTSLADSTVQLVLAELQESSFYRSFIENEFRDALKDILFDEELEFIIAPGNSANQLVWMYNYDYCQAVLGDLAMFPFSDSLPMIMLSIDFEAGQFEYIHQKEFAEVLKLIKLKEKRQIELWSFSIPTELLCPKDVMILSLLDEGWQKVPERLEQLKLERSNRVKFSIEKVATILSKLELSAGPTERQFSDGINSVMADKFSKRENILFRIDSGQTINSSNEFTTYPSTKSYTMSEQEKGKLKGMYLIEFPASKKFYAFYSFGVLNHQFMLMTTKASKYQWYILPPTAESAEYGELVETYVQKELEVSLSTFLSIYGKLWFNNDYGMESYHLASNLKPEGDQSSAKESPSKLGPSTSTLMLSRAKDYFEQLESGDRYLHYFKDPAFKTQEPKKAELEGLPANRLGLSFKGLLNMVFLSFSASTESSELNLTPFTLKKPDSSPPKNSYGVPPVHAADAVFSKKELLGFVNVNLLESLEYLDIKQKKLKVLGTTLMRQGDKFIEEQLVLLFELAKIGLLHGRPFSKPSKKAVLKGPEETYLASALRKTSEELRVKHPNNNSSKDDFPSLGNGSAGSHSNPESLSSASESEPEESLNILAESVARLKDKLKEFGNKSASECSLDLLAEGLASPQIATVNLVSRVYVLVEFSLAASNHSAHGGLPAADIDTSRFLSLVAAVHQTLRYRAESYFSLAVAAGGKSLLLKEIEELKLALPFRKSLCGFLSNLVKESLFEYLVLKEVRQSKSAPSAFKSYLEKRCTLADLTSRYPGFASLQADLLKGLRLWSHSVKMLNSLTERGLDGKSTTAPHQWGESLSVLTGWLQGLGISLDTEE